MDILEHYESHSLENRELDYRLVETFVNKSIVPDQIRYEFIGSVVRGAISDSITKSKYLFTYGDGGLKSLILVENAEQMIDYNMIFKSVADSVGCDLMKADVGGGQIPGVPMPEEEEDFIERQDDALTDHHPGAATSHTTRS